MRLDDHPRVRCSARITRGLLDDVIVMCTGEFWRLPITEGSAGRDHNRNAFKLVMAGGGFKPGLTYGTTDEFGYRAVKTGAVYLTCTRPSSINWGSTTHGWTISIWDVPSDSQIPVSRVPKS